MTVQSASITQVLRILAQADTSAFRGVSDELDGIDRRAGKASQGLSTFAKVGLGAVAAGGGLAVAGLAGAVSTAADFQQAVANVGSVTGATAGELAELRKEALAVGKDTSKSASESVAAFGELLKAGMSVKDVVGGAGRTVVQLAEATGASVADMAALLSNTLNTFGLSADQAANVANTLARAANASAIDVADLAQSLQAVGPVAKQAGLSTDDFATAIGILGNHALKGSDAGTSLKTMLLALTAPTDKAKGLMQAYGVSVFDAQGKVRGFRDILGDLQRSLKDASDEERSAVLKDIFGTDAIRAANILLGEGVEGWDKFTGAMGRAPTVADMSTARLNTLKGRIEQLKGSLETLAIIVGEKVLPALTWVADHALDWVNRLMGVDADKLFGHFSGITDRIKGLFTPGAISLTDEEGNEITMRLASPYEVARDRIGQAASAARARLTSELIDLGPEASATGQQIIDAFAAIGAWFSQHWETIWGALGPVVSLYTDFIQGKVENLLTVIRGVFQVIEGLFTGDWGKMWDGLRTIVKAVMSDVGDTFTFYKDLTIHVFNQLREAATTILSALWEWMRTELPQWAARAGDLLAELPGVIGNSFGAARDWATARLGELWDWLAARLPGWGAAAGEFLADLPGVIGGLFKDAAGQSLTALGELWDWLAARLPGWGAAIGGFLGDVAIQICGVFKNAATTAVHRLGEAWDWLKAEIPSWPDKIWNGLKALVDVMCDIGKRAAAGLVSFLAAGLSKVKEPLDWILDRFGDFVSAINAVLDKLGVPKLPGLSRLGGGSGAPVPAPDSGASAPAGAASLGDVIPLAQAAACFAEGGAIDQPTYALMGEDAPAHPEYVIPTNPRYRHRAMALMGQAAERLGLPRGGPLGLLGDLASGALGSVADWIRDGALALIEKIIDRLGLAFGNLDGLAGDLATGAFRALKDGVIGFVQGALNRERSDRGTLSQPLAGAIVTQEFGERPEVYGPGGHTGIDLAGLPIGSPVRAAAAGDVTAAGAMGSYGTAAILSHLEGLSTLYAHLQENMQAMAGQALPRGGAIGGMGYTGRVEPPGPAGAHLHFEVRRGGAPVNPRGYLRFARGGVINRRVLLVDPETGALIGEAGEQQPEAIIPLGRGGPDDGGAGSGVAIATVNVTAGSVNVAGGRGGPAQGAAAAEQTSRTEYTSGINVEETMNYMGILDLLRSIASDEFGTFETISAGFDLGQVLAGMGMTAQQLMAAIATNPGGAGAIVDDLTRRALAMRASRNPASANFNPVTAAMATFGMSATPDAVRSLINDPEDAALFEEALRASGGDMQRAAQVFADIKQGRSDAAVAVRDAAPRAAGTATPERGPLSGEARRQWAELDGTINDLNTRMSTLDEDLAGYRERLAAMDPASGQAEALRSFISSLEFERDRMANERAAALAQQAEIGRTGQAAAEGQQVAAAWQSNAAGEQSNAAEEQQAAAEQARLGVNEFGDTVDEFGAVVETLDEALARVGREAEARGESADAAIDAEIERRRQHWREERGLPPDAPTPFADGGVITDPTWLVSVASGQVYGIMAESGPEAILPTRLALKAGLLPGSGPHGSLASEMSGERVQVVISNPLVLNEHDAARLGALVADHVDRALGGRV